MMSKVDKIADPVDHYNHPDEVEADNELSIEDKITLLTNWLDDIKLQQVAEEENMPSENGAHTYIEPIKALLRKYRQE